MKKLLKSSAQLVAEARSRIKEIDIDDAKTMLDNDDVLFVDIRDVRERKRSGYLPGSFHAPRGMLEFWVDPESPYFKDVFDQSKQYVFYCASGWRSALTVAALQDMGFEAAHMKGGFTEWQKSKGLVEGGEADK
ncbi:MAG: rhodanese-like domain-containing protein [Granulosicoccus sp.]|nr:rhodanese-like domain-containing protein [Granulosicoccus sp.]